MERAGVCSPTEQPTVPEWLKSAAHGHGSPDMACTLPQALPYYYCHDAVDAQGLVGEASLVK